MSKLNRLDELQTPLVIKKKPHTPQRVNSNVSTISGVVGESNKCKKFVLKFQVIIAGAFIALVSGTPTAFNKIEDFIVKDTHISEGQMALIHGVGMLGMFMTLPIGLVLDKIGAQATALLCSFGVVIGYVAMSFMGKDTWWLMILWYAMVGFGSGGAFTAVLSSMVSLGRNAGLGVSVAACCISLSGSPTAGVVSLYSDLTDCHGAECWPQWCRLLGGVTALMIPGSIFLSPMTCSKRKLKNGIGACIDSICNRRKADTLDVERERGISVGSVLDIADDVSVDFSIEPQEPDVFTVLRSGLFWVLFVCYSAGIAGGLASISKFKESWSQYLSDTNTSPHDRRHLMGWIDTVFLLFPVANCLGSLLGGWIMDLALRKYNIPRLRYCGLVSIVWAGSFATRGALSCFGNGSEWQHTLFVSLLILEGFGYGTWFSTFPPVVSEVFGPKSFGKNFGLLQIGSSTMSLVVPFTMTRLQSHFRYVYFGYCALLLVAGFIMIPMCYESPFAAGGDDDDDFNDEAHPLAKAQDDEVYSFEAP